MRLRALFIFLFIPLFLAFVTPSIKTAKAQTTPINGDRVGPEIPEPRAGSNVIDRQNYTGVATPINNITDNPFNPVPKKNNRPTVLRVEVNVNTTPGEAQEFAEKLLSSDQFPNGAIVILGNELNNLDHEWENPNMPTGTAARQYANVFNAFSNVLRNQDKYKVAPAPPDMYNARYDPVEWLEAFKSRVNCANIDVLVANVFDKVEPRTGGNSKDSWIAYQNSINTKCSGKRVVHFEGWGTHPDSSIKEQVEFLNTEPLPPGVETATTLIVDNCRGKKGNELKRDWMYYIRGKVFKADGTEVDPETCSTSTGEVATLPEPELIACNNTTDSEFHPLRPYPASSCDRVVHETALMCGNDLIVKTTFRKTRPPGCTGRICTFTEKGVQSQISINLKNAELPILGNTELVPNVLWKDNKSYTNLTSGQRMNEYVSWYLNGIISPVYEEDRNSYKTTEESFINRLVNYSGPLRKLLPWEVQARKHVESIVEGALAVNKNPSQFMPQAEANKIKNSKTFDQRHDQIVGCTIADLLKGDAPANCNITGVIIGLGRQRLSSWLNSNFVNAFKSIPFIPPFAANFSDQTEYIKAYKEWKNGTPCTLSIGRLYFCPPNLLSSSFFWSGLFPDIPLSSTEDRIGEVFTDENRVADNKRELANTIQLKDGQGNGGTVTNVYFTTDTSKNHNLYFAHTEETSELAKLLQGTFASKSSNNFDWEKDLENAITNQSNAPLFNTYGCEKQDIRSNPGDNLYGDLERDSGQRISGTLTYDVTFNCEFKPEEVAACKARCTPTPGGSPNEVSECQRKCDEGNICEKDIVTSLAVYTKTPQVFEIWQRLVDGPMGVFKRFFPKAVSGAPIEDIQEIPAATKAVYNASGSNSTEALAGDPSLNRKGTDAQLFFPYIGGLQEYFLKGIQKALRPKDVGLDTLSGAPLEGAFCPFENTALSCRNFAPGNGTNGCANYPGSAQGRGASASISKGVVALAVSVSEQTCTPPEIIIGVMAKESTGRKVTSFNPLAEEPVTGDPNQKLGRNTWCKDEYANTEDSPFYRALPGCGPFTYSQIDLDRQIARYDDEDKIKDCINKVVGTIGDGRGIRSDGDIDTRKMATSMCVGSAKLWEGLSGRGTCDHKSHPMSEFDQGEIEFALADYHGNDEANGNYLSFISQYSGFVNDVKTELTSCQNTASSP